MIISCMTKNLRNFQVSQKKSMTKKWHFQGMTIIFQRKSEKYEKKKPNGFAGSLAVQSKPC